MLGDSTMLSSNSPEGKKLRDCAQDELDRLRRRRDPEIVVINAGKGGEMATAGYGRLKDNVLAHEPAVVTVSYGLNDTNVLTPEQFRQALVRILTTMRNESEAKVVLLTSTPFVNEHHSWGKRYETRGGLDEYMDRNICSVTRAVAEEQKTALCDLHEAFKTAPNLAKLIRPDGVHLTEEGNEAAAKALAPVIYSELTGRGK